MLDNLVRMRALGWWLEVTTLILEGLNDGEAELRALARFIRDELGADTPWHVTAFHPAYRMTDHPATRAETLAALPGHRSGRGTALRVYGQCLLRGRRRYAPARSVAPPVWSGRDGRLS